MTVTAPWIGRPLPRLEDRRLLEGRGQFVEDVTFEGQLYVVFVRSPHPHADILSLDTAASRAMQGVVTVLTHEDLNGIGSIVPNWILPGTKSAGRQVLAEKRVRYVGDPVAAIVASSEAAALDAADAVDVIYRELPFILSAEAALKEDAPQVHADIANNLATTFLRGEPTYDTVSDGAHLKLSFSLRNQRLVPFPIECRALNASFDVTSGRMTLYITHQLPHMLRRMLSEALDFPENKLRVISPDVGGGFGAKMHFYSEDVVIAFASRLLGRPVKWSERRRENAVATSHGRDHVTQVDVAADQEGKIQALRVNSIANIGGYLSSMGAGIPTINAAMGLLGVYDIPNADIGVHLVYTNTTPVDAYRGAGRPEASYIIERTIDRVARELGLDPAEVRARNFLREDQLPHRNLIGGMIDSGNYQATLDRALALSGYLIFKTGKDDRSAFRQGIGLCTYTESCGLGPGELLGMVGFDRGGYESARVRVHSDGRVLVLSGSHSHGQGHVTTFAQIAADALGVSPDEIDVIQGDTQLVPQGVGTFNSRSVAVGGSAVRVASERVAERINALAAHLLQVEPDEMERDGDCFRVKDGDGAILFREVCRAAWTGHNVPRELGIGLEETEFYHPLSMSAPYGAHVAKVRVDTETGEVALLSYVAVDDCGTVINPLLARGQVQGGVMQGIGQALFENGTPLSDGHMLLETAIPRADTSFNIVTDHIETPTLTNPLGAKGLGEAGTIGAPPAVVNAVIDALWTLGVKAIDMPLTPERVLSAIEQAKEGGAS